jgi:phosphoglycolate phosphatase-like HAD superfamily hydrolase
MNSGKTYKHFIFDFDGVVCDSLSLAIEKFNEIRQFHFPQLPIIKSKEDMILVFGGPLKKSLNRWIEQEGTSTFFNLHSAKMNENRQVLIPFIGIIEVLNSLGTGNVSIVTSSYSEAVEFILKKDSNYKKEIFYKIAGRELHQSKTEKISNILSELQISKEDAIYIGDLESDILYCRDVPIDIISVGYGYHPMQYLLQFKPTYIAPSITDLKSLINKIH